MLSGRRVRFGSSDGYLVESPEIMTEMESVLGYQPGERRYIMINEGNVEYLKQRPYRVGLSTLGKKYLLYLTCLGERRYAVFFDRSSGRRKEPNKKLILAKFKFPSILFEGGGTIIEGELLLSDDQPALFLATDLLARSGSPVPPGEREDSLREILLASPRDGPCQFEVREHFQYKHIESLLTEYCTNQKYAKFVIGLHFKPGNGRGKDMIYILPEHRHQPGTRSSDQVVPRKRVSQEPPLPSIPGLILPGASPEAPVEKVSSERKASVKKSSERKASVKAPKKMKGPPKREKVFEVKDDPSLPDTYELWCDGSMVGYAAIPDMETTQLMNRLMDEGATKVTCQWNSAFEKWVPIK